MCAVCSNNVTESAMATVLKQVLKYECNAVCEYDAGYRGVNGGISKYDIYIPDFKGFKVLVECQSRYHDNYANMNNDTLKEKYALKNGYKLIALDSRDYTPLEAIQKFLPQAKKIPYYVDMSVGNKKIFPIKEAQDLLNEGKTYNEISNILGVYYTTIANQVRKGNLCKTKRYIATKHTQVVIQLDINGKQVGKYDLSKIRHTGNEKNYNRKIQIVRACRSLSHLYMGYYWYYESE